MHQIFPIQPTNPQGYIPPDINEVKKDQLIEFLNTNANLLMTGESLETHTIEELKARVFKILKEGTILAAANCLGITGIINLKDHKITEPYQGIFSGSYNLGKKTIVNGTIEYGDGIKFCGTFHENGHRKDGTLTFSNGDTFDGTFDENGKRKDGTLTFSNGDTFKGTFYENRKLKDGKYTFSNGDTFDGTFHENGQLKEGTYSWSNKRLFKGTFEKGSLLKGIMTWPDDCIFNGSFKGIGLYTRIHEKGESIMSITYAEVKKMRGEDTEDLITQKFIQ